MTNYNPDLYVCTLFISMKVRTELQRKKMKVFELFFIVVCFVEVNSKFLSLLYHLKMDNPVIVGKISDLKNKEMIQLFKDVNVLGQSVNMITMLGNNSLQRSTGIIIQPDDTTLNKFNAQNVKKFVKVLFFSNSSLYILAKTGLS